jgi:hypothetical protein
MRILASIVAAGLFAFSLAAHADTIVTFDVSGLFHVDSAILSGNFTMDTTTGIITSVDMFVGARDSFTLNGIYEQGCTSGTGGANCVVTFDTNGTGFATYPIVNLQDSLGMLANYSTNGSCALRLHGLAPHGGDASRRRQGRRHPPQSLRLGER